ncbi:hypothetical protein POREN0001_0189 [Porphyromonas endodontalis ATCC 35406]|uniref:Uncharacterized protein n=1 Tax=Porphyromonas endodontalis (strain ATCC 35406 / DSM 24491 / JCM 8526 / CCUG 16442 / BCRC 14492 / NCTC 13058 / HG 370) TaxID=553175 RepID=C3JAF3_POREA|nr:hypothetical protein POREN0001_0189 [Porphyromonas endodontalis ATCC 35406]
MQRYGKSNARTSFGDLKVQTFPSRKSMEMLKFAKKYLI